MKNKQKHCPWCGKKFINSPAGFKKLLFNIAPVHYCYHCSGALSSRTSSVLLALALFFVIFVYINGNVVTAIMVTVPLLLIYFVVLMFITPSLYKINSDGKGADTIGTRAVYIADDIVGVKFYRNKVFLTHPEFHRADAYTVSSPVRVVKYCDKTREITLEFFYINGTMETLLENDTLILYEVLDERLSAISVRKK